MNSPCNPMHEPCSPQVTDSTCGHRAFKKKKKLPVDHRLHQQHRRHPCLWYGMLAGATRRVERERARRKYRGERTSLTAATCIDNPFDLEEATRSSPYHVAIDQKLTGGLIDILRTNKELFQGKTEGFDVERALLAKSVRDFENAISMMSYGYGF